MLSPVSARQLREATPVFLNDRTQPYRRPLNVRCGIVNYLLHSEDGTIEDRIYELVSKMPIEIGREEKQVA